MSAEAAEAAYRRALEEEVTAERRYRLARIATDRAREALLSARARMVTRGPTAEEIGSALAQEIR